jgi:NAD(P)-dependent dehydrogenase (short-subunit alcohol dehydrogenase family)
MAVQPTMAGATPKALRSKADQVLANREIRATLQAIEAAGGEARYLAVDVQSAAEVARALEPLRAAWGPVTGLIHAAGVIEDRRIVDKTAAQVDRVLGTKVDGLNALLAATAADPLKLICLYSSISGRTGNIGQSDYAMGNEILNKVARSLAHQRPGCRVKSIGWGPWKGGMVTPAHEEVFKAQGVPLIPLQEGANMLVAELSSPEGVEVVLGASPVSKELVVDLLVSRDACGS